MSAEFDRLVTEFEKFQSKLTRVDEQFANLGQMQQELNELEVSAASADRSITVVAGPGGSIKDIQLTDKALGQTPQALSSALLSTIQQAMGEAARRQAAIVDDLFGGDMGLTDQVLETQAELFGTSTEELRERLAEERPRQRPASEDYDDYSTRSVLRSPDDEPSTPASPPNPGGSAGDDFLRDLFNNEDR